MILFHMGFIVLHTNMTDIHGAVRELSVGKASDSAPTSAISRWRETDDCRIASLHARSVIDLGTRIVIRSRRGQSSHVAAVDDETRSDEAPHVAICVYLAVITQFIAEAGDRPTNSQGVRAVLDKGQHILQRLSLRIAYVLGNILRGLEQKIHQGWIEK
jgi:hypothetical protein